MASWWLEIISNLESCTIKQEAIKSISGCKLSGILMFQISIVTGTLFIKSYFKSVVYTPLSLSYLWSVHCCHLQASGTFAVVMIHCIPTYKRSSRWHVKFSFVNQVRKTNVVSNLCISNRMFNLLSNIQTLDSGTNRAVQQRVYPEPGADTVIVYQSLQ